MRPKQWYRIKKVIPKFLYDDLIKVYYDSRSLFYRGDKVECPCCERRHSKFHMSGKYGSCPSCGAGARHRNMYFFLKNNVNLLAKEKIDILHFAPEYCSINFFKKLQSDCNYISADISSSRAKEKIDMTCIPYEANSFDVILSSHVLEHVENDITAMCEIFRVLKSGGFAINQVPIDLNRSVTFEDKKINTAVLRHKHYGHSDHKRIYGRDYKTRLESAGFIVTASNYIKNLPDDIINKHGLNPNEVVFYCEKS